jgi:hypothetical protein
LFTVLLRPGYANRLTEVVTLEVPEELHLTPHIRSSTMSLTTLILCQIVLKCMI